MGTKLKTGALTTVLLPCFKNEAIQVLSSYNGWNSNFCCHCGRGWRGLFFLCCLYLCSSCPVQSNFLSFPPFWNEKKNFYITLSYCSFPILALFHYLCLLSFRQVDTINLQTSRQDGLRKLSIILLNFHRVGVPIQSSQMQPQSEPPWVNKCRIITWITT